MPPPLVKSLDDEERPALSVVIPIFNEPYWIEHTYWNLVRALENARLHQVEIILVDDGSDTETVNVLKGLSSRYLTHVVRTKNQGRLLARKTGLRKAKYPHVLLLDSRIDLDPESLVNLVGVLGEHDRPNIVIFDVDIDTNHDFLNSFWKVVTRIAWRSYYRDPQSTFISPGNFDAVPKGTTCLYGSLDLLIWGHTQPRFVVEDLRFANDDTLILRELSSVSSILIDPKIRCLYHGRKNALRMGIKHTFHRGTVFATGYLQSFNRYSFLLLILLATFIMMIALLPTYPVVVSLFAMSLAILLVLVSHKVTRSWEDVIRFVLILPVFAAVYSLGIIRGLLLMLKARRRS